MKPSNISLTEILKALENFDLDAAPIFGGPTELNTVYAYSRARAIEDGVLIDVTRQAKDLGIRCPAALTALVWAEIVTASVADEFANDITEETRVKELLEMAAMQMEATTNKAARFLYYATTSINSSKNFELMVIMSAGDDGREVLTVMFPHED